MRLRDDVKRRFIERRGFWHASLDPFLDLNPHLLDAYLEFSTLVSTKGALQPKEREFIYIAIDCNASHLYEAGLRLHIQAAFERGATPSELRQVLQLVSLIGFESIFEGVRHLEEELAESGKPAFHADSEDATAVRNRYLSNVGHWSHGLERTLAADPRIVARLADMEVAVRQAGPIPPRMQALIRLAVAMSPTRLDRQSGRYAMREAIAAGASAQEILQVIELASVVGLHSCTFGAPILADELRKAGLD